MNRKKFEKTIGIIISIYFFVLGLIAACAMDGLLYHILGIVSLIVAGVVFLCTILKNVVTTSSRISKTFMTIAISSTLLVIGFMIVTKNVLFGLALVFAGFIGCAFILPAAKGFKDDDNITVNKEGEKK